MFWGSSLRAELGNLLLELDEAVVHQRGELGSHRKEPHVELSKGV